MMHLEASTLVHTFLPLPVHRSVSLWSCAKVYVVARCLLGAFRLSMPVNDTTTLRACDFATESAYYYKCPNIHVLQSTAGLQHGNRSSFLLFFNLDVIVARFHQLSVANALAASMSRLPA